MTNNAQRITDLIKSVGLDAPKFGELNERAWVKIADALEKLVAVAKEAEKYLKSANADQRPLEDALLSLKVPR